VTSLGILLAIWLCIQAANSSEIMNHERLSVLLADEYLHLWEMDRCVFRHSMSAKPVEYVPSAVTGRGSVMRICGSRVMDLRSMNPNNMISHGG
jgi:hypothetical protein